VAALDDDDERGEASALASGARELCGSTSVSSASSPCAGGESLCSGGEVVVEQARIGSAQTKHTQVATRMLVRKEV
jgi:hypothetical protein